MRVHDSQAYRKMDVTRERTGRILKLREILLSFQTGFNLVSAASFGQTIYSAGFQHGNLNERRRLQGDILFFSVSTREPALATQDTEIMERIWKEMKSNGLGRWIFRNI